MYSARTRPLVSDRACADASAAWTATCSALMLRVTPVARSLRADSYARWARSTRGTIASTRSAAACAAGRASALDSARAETGRPASSRTPAISATARREELTPGVSAPHAARLTLPGHRSPGV